MVTFFLLKIRVRSFLMAGVCLTTLRHIFRFFDPKVTIHQLLRIHVSLRDISTHSGIYKKKKKIRAEGLDSFKEFFLRISGNRSAKTNVLSRYLTSARIFCPLTC